MLPPLQKGVRGISEAAFAGMKEKAADLAVSSLALSAICISEHHPVVL
jgi:acyl-CoA hydrolase